MRHRAHSKLRLGGCEGYNTVVLNHILPRAQLHTILNQPSIYT